MAKRDDHVIDNAILQAAATIFASLGDGEPMSKAAAKEARKYAITQAYLLQLAVTEMRSELDKG